MNKRNKRVLNEKVNDKQKRSNENDPLDTFKDQQFVDEIPLEDLKIETDQETKKEKSQSTSQSERKYKSGFNNDE